MNYVQACGNILWVFSLFCGGFAGFVVGALVGFLHKPAP